MILLTVARKPFQTTLLENLRTQHVGALHVDGCRLGRIDTATNEALQAHPERALGRWPSNILFEHRSGCVCTGTRQVKGVSGGAAGTVIRSITRSDTRTWGLVGRVLPAAVGYAQDGMETIEAWSCVIGCPVLELDGLEAISRYFKTFGGTTNVGPTTTRS